MAIIKIGVCVGLFLLGLSIGIGKGRKSLKTHERAIIELNETVDSLSNARDTLIITKYETRIKWRVKNEKEIIYIVKSNDSMQPRIRTDLRNRYIAER